MAHRKRSKSTVIFVSVLLTCALMLSYLTVGGLSAFAANDSSVDSNALVTYGYMQKAFEEWKAEVLQEVAELIGSKNTDIDISTLMSPYKELTLNKGALLLPDAAAEVIFRGGDAVVITVSKNPGQGFTDLADATESFSGETLRFGHIYYQTNADNRACILVTGDRAAFTVKGKYEIR